MAFLSFGKDLKTASASASGSILSKSELSGFTKFINGVLGADKDQYLMGRLPIVEDESNILESLKDGVIFCKLINFCVPGVIDETQFDFELSDEKSRTFRMLENVGLCLDGARRIGCNIVSIAPNDVLKKNAALVYGLLWQVIKYGSLSHVNLGKHPELNQIGGEDLATLPAEDLLLRWFNYHMEKSGIAEKATNFGSSIKDSILYGHLINRIGAPGCIDLEALKVEKCLEKRAEIILSATSKMMDGISFLTAKDIVDGNEKLNLVLVANLFKKKIGIGSFTEEIDNLKAQLEEKSDAVESLTLLVKTLESDIQDQRNTAKNLSQKLFSLSAEKAELEERLDNIQDEQSKTKDSIDFQMSLVSTKFEKMAKDLKEEKALKEKAVLELDASRADLEKANNRLAQIDLLIQHLMAERMKSEDHVQRLRKFYNTFSTADALAKFIFKSIDCESIESDPAVSWKGKVFRKGRSKDVLKSRYLVLCENFMFIYRAEACGKKEEPLAIYRLDDCVLNHRSREELNLPDTTNSQQDSTKLKILSVDGNIGFGFKGSDTVFIALEDESKYEKLYDCLQFASSWWIKRGKIIQEKQSSSRRSSFSIEAQPQSFTKKL